MVEDKIRRFSREFRNRREVGYESNPQVPETPQNRTVTSSPENAMYFYRKLVTPRTNEIPPYRPI